MLTYTFENRKNDSLYESLYKQIKADILSGNLKPNEKLPSKRAFAKHLNISTITIETAYSQLIAEGYLYSVPKSGYYVSEMTSVPFHQSAEKKSLAPVFHDSTEYFADFVTNTSADTFPFVTWKKLMRETLSDEPQKLMVQSPSTGIYVLRHAIANYLFQFRGMSIDPDQIIIGAGTEYLYGILIQLLGRHLTYALEEPGYRKIDQIYAANHVQRVHIPMDQNGVKPDALISSNADILHISPSHHFPTGIITPAKRRYQLLDWCSKDPDRYIIEDDYDSEFRLLGKPIPALQSMDKNEKVIYINTFSKSLTSTIRISYMVLPRPLMQRYQTELNFYSCTVSTFEQYTLAKFIDEGHFEKHINRMRNHYRSLRDALIDCIKRHPAYSLADIKEEHAGLHFLLTFKTALSDTVIIQKARQQGIHINALSQYYFEEKPSATHTFVLNYSGIPQDRIEESIQRLFSCILL